MPTQREIIIDCDADGVSVNINGMQGKGCEAIHKAFATLGSVTEHKKKPEYFKNDTARVNVSASR